MVRREYELGTSELAVLRVLWDEGALPVREVMNHLHQRGRHIAYTTVQTLLTRLEQKGFVTSNKSDLAHVFRAKLSRERVRKNRLKALVEQLYDGAAGPLVLQLVQNEKLSPTEIEALQKLITDLDRKPNRS